MKKAGKVVSLNRLNLSFILKCDRVKLSLYLLSVIGLFAGFALYSKDSCSGYIAKFLFSNLLSFKLRKDIVLSIIIALSSFISVIVVSVIFGASVFGIVVIPIFLMIINGLFGTMLALSYQSYKIAGLAFNSVLLIPSFAVFIIALTISYSAILKYSIFQLNALNSGSGGKLSVEFSRMLKKQLTVLIILIPNAVLEVILDQLFIKSFDFV